MHVRIGVSLLLATALAACSSSSTPFSPAVSNPTAVRQPGADALALWRHEQTHVPLPGAGCFSASYPAIAWTRVECVAPANIWFPPVPRQGGVSPNIVGNGADYALDSSPQVISSATGGFPTVTGVTQVRSRGVPSFGGHATSGPNVYSIQLNSNTFPSKACGTLAHCLAWEQFVYTNQPAYYKGGGNLIIQDWLLSSTTKGLSGCPKGKRWQRSSGSCVQNAPKSLLIPNVPITELSEVTLTGNAEPSGDSTIVGVGTQMYAINDAQGDAVTDLAQGWNEAEFNIVGNGGGSRAIFNPGSTITVMLEANTGVSTAPSCQANSGTTGESNNLKFVTAPASPTQQQDPSIAFTESNVSGGKGTCDVVPASGS